MIINKRKGVLGLVCLTITLEIPKLKSRRKKNRLEFRHAKICKILRHAKVMQDLTEYHKDTHSLYVVFSIHLLVL